MHANEPGSTFRWGRGLLSAALLAIALSGCNGCGPAEPTVVVYTALDAEFSEPLLEQFAAEHKIRVLPKFDSESVKTVGLTNAIIQESNRPRCDLFWNNEILNTLRLQKRGLVDVYLAPAAEAYPAGFRSPQGEWYGFAARARVLIINTQLVAADQRPTSIQDLVDPKWKGKVGIAKPLFGTTATHATVLYSHWGKEQAEAYFLRLKENAEILGGNKGVARAVAAGQLAFGLTDTDDAIIEQDKGFPVEIVYPDQGEDELGTLLIPNTLCLIKGSPHGEEARALIDFLLTPEVEAQLAQGSSAQFPLHAKASVQSRAAPATPPRWMHVDFPAAAEHWEATAAFLQQHFTGPK